MQNIKSKLSNDSEEIGEIDVANKFFKEFEAYHNDKKNLKAALSPYKVSFGIIFWNCQFITKYIFYLDYSRK